MSARRIAALRLLALAFGASLLLLAFALAARAEVYRFEPVAVIDGDTVRGKICWWAEIRLPGQRMSVPFCVEENVRVSGVDTPELHGKCDAERDAAKRARAFVLGALDGLAGDRVPGAEFVVRFPREAVLVTREGAERDKYGRALGDVLVQGASLRQALIDTGNGRAYDGGARHGWCSPGGVS